MSDPLVALHAGSAVVCLLLGSYQLFRRIKGDVRHRVTGWVWVAGMTFVATSSFAIRDLRDGQFSLLHVLSVATLGSLLGGMIAVRRQRVAAHRALMRGSWIGLVGAFLGAVAVPDRTIPRFVVTEPTGAALAGLALLLMAAAVIVVGHVADGWLRSEPSPTGSDTSSEPRPASHGGSRPAARG